MTLLQMMLEMMQLQALRKKVKADTDGRFMKDGSGNAADTLKTFKETDEINGNDFGEVWYKTTLMLKMKQMGMLQILEQ